MKIAVLNDSHTGIRNSSEIFLDNAAKFYKEIFFPTCDERGIDQILHLGDYYDHRKFVNFKALNHNRKHFLNEVRSRGMKMDIIPFFKVIALDLTTQILSGIDQLIFF